MVSVGLCVHPGAGVHGVLVYMRDIYTCCLGSMVRLRLFIFIIFSVVSNSSSGSALCMSCVLSDLSRADSADTAWDNEEFSEKVTSEKKSRGVR